jgi:hypothetical protein
MVVIYIFCRVWVENLNERIFGRPRRGWYDAVKWILNNQDGLINMAHAEDKS